MMLNFRSIFLFALFLPLPAIAEQTWKINLVDTQPAEAIAHLDEMFSLSAVNPAAKCLQLPVTFVSDKVWHESEAKELVSQIVEKAGCGAVIFQGSQYVVQGSVL